ncbi:MAG: AAA family ATPase [Pseudomonadota bacterium]|nr:AAA family ATPase [Pseudomonadota bacterium]
MHLSPYVPMDRLHALAGCRELPDRATGSVLFADICGFMALTESLAASLGPRRGSEELAVRLNQVYDALIAEVHQYGGSVISFAGDAVTCWFDDRRGAAAGRAVACALAMQRAMDPFAGLSLKVGMASGPARRLRVGDPAIHYLDTLAGATVARMAVAEGLAGEGEVVVDNPTVVLADGSLHLSAWRSDPLSGERFAVAGGLKQPVSPRPWPPLALPAAEAMRPWLLPPLYERLRQGLGEFLTELRPAVALFLRFAGIDYDADPEAGRKLDAYVCWVQRLVAHYAGIVVQLIVGDKGSYLVAAFGAPVAHEDDARRAVAAALQIARPPPALDFVPPPQLGISQGIMRTGAYGGTLRRTYGVLGDDVNVAARLMQHAAPGQVLASGRVRKAAARAFAWEALPPVQIKGRRQPVTVFHPRGPAQGVTRTATAMVGREAEWAPLAARLHDLRRGRGGLVLIEGEAGIGKSRLVDEVIWRARRLDITPLAGAGDAVEQATSYHAWQGVFRQLFQLDKSVDAAEAGLRQAGAELAEEQIAAVAAALQARVPDLAHLTPLLNVVLPLELADNAATAAMTGEVRAEYTQRLLAALINDAARRAPQVLIMEDAHWLDSASWGLIRRLARIKGPLLLVIATRPPAEPISADYARLIKTPGLLHLRLATLAPEAIQRLLCERLGVAELPPPVAEFIRDKAEGSPFFSEELAYALRDTGLIRIEAGACRLAPGVADLRSLSFPDTIEGVIISRIDRLPPPTQLTLKVASVIGRLFAYRLLLAIHPIAADKPRLLAELADLERLDLTPLDAPEPERVYVFKHIITQEVAYNLLSFAQRRALHRAVAQWYEGRQGKDRSAHDALLAYHWSRAEAWPQALACHEAAGDAAARLYAYNEAHRHYSEGLEALRRLADDGQSRRRRVDLLIKLASVAFAVAAPGTNLQLMAEAQCLCQGLPEREDMRDADALRLAQVHYWMGRYHFYLGGYLQCIGYMERTLAAAKALKQDELLAMASSLSGQAKAVLGRFDAAQDLLEPALAPLERYANWSEWVRTAIYLGAAKAARGDYHGGLACLDQGLERATRTHNAAAACTCHLLAWTAHFMARHLPGMEEAARNAVATAASIGYGYYQYWAYGFAGWTAILAGDLAAAADHLARSQAIGRTFGPRPIMAEWFAIAEAELAFRRRRIEETLVLAQAAAELAEAEGKVFSCGLAHRLRAEALAALDPPRRSEAEAHLATALHFLEAGDARLEAARTRVVWGQICLAQGNHDAARRHWEQAAGQFQVTGLGGELAEVRGLVAGVGGK